MGFNSTLLILNDSLWDLGKDPELGKRIDHLLSLHMVGEKDIRNDIQVLAQDHADSVQLIATGGNCGTRILSLWRPRLRHDKEDGQLELLKAFADKLGYSVSKKPKKKE